MNALLHDPIFRVKLASHTSATSLSLAEVCEAVWTQPIVSFEGLRTHQRQAWASFLSQLMVMALDRAGKGVQEAASLDASAWRALLLSLSDGEESAWNLVEPDVSKPAFMQSPIPEGSLDDAKYKDPYTTPDELDMLVTSKNHDLKRQLMHKPELDQWIYALITLQTMEGVFGTRNYGIIRMHTGWGNRPKVGYTTKLDWSTRQQRDVKILLQQRKDQTLSSYKKRKHTCIWTVPWDGKSQIQLHDCDPHFIEICRRVRFKREQDSIIAYKKTTSCKRIHSDQSIGSITHDPWAPLYIPEANTTKCLTVGKSGFTYDLIRQIIYPIDDYISPYTMNLTDAEKKQNIVYLVAEAMTRGKGKTEGLHERIIPVPVRKTGLMALRGKFRQRVEEQSEEDGAEELRKLATRARQRADLAGKIRSKALYPALKSLTDKDVDRWTNAYTHAVDACFFTELFGQDASTTQEEMSLDASWQKTLYTLASAQLEKAIEELPLSNSRRWQQISQATNILKGSARKHLTAYFQQEPY